MNTTINHLLPRFFFNSGIQQIEYLSPRNTIIGGAALAALGCLCLYKYCKPHSLSPDLRKYIVIIPYDGSDGEKKRTFEEMKGLYDQAKSVILSLPQDFKSKVNFNDEKLEIGIRYDKTTLERLAKHEKLWWIFAPEDSYILPSADSIFDSFSNRFCVKDLDKLKRQQHKSEEELKRNSEDFFQNECEVQAPPHFDRKRIIPTHEELLSTIFTKSKGLSIGENHSQTSSEAFLVSQMSSFVRHNVETLFIEGLPYESLQNDLDAYFHPDTPVEEIPLSIDYHFFYRDVLLNFHGGYSYVDVIKAAKKAGIKRIVGIDTILAHGDKDKDRVVAMNYFATQIIDREMPKGNYVIFSGAGHSTTELEISIPGFSQIFGIPSILIYDARSSEILNAQGSIIKGDSFHYRPDFAVGISPEDRRKK